MGADIKSLRIRIKSVDSTLHLTKAMGLVASSKIRGATAAMMKSRDYTSALGAVVDQLSSCADCRKSPFVTGNSTGKTRLVVIAGDRGFAGGYNANVFREAAEHPDAEVIPIGKRACEKYGAPIISSEKFSLIEACKLAKQLCEDFKNGEFDRLGIVGTRYASMMTQEAFTQWILPLESKGTRSGTGVVFEPNESYILDAAVSEYATGVIYGAVRESYACEVVARRMAMDSAGKNAQQMTDDLRLAYNRARQGAITQEITEIIAGSNA